VRVRPDVVFRRARVAVFIDGCFWHGCPVHGTRPRSNTAYWDTKIARNRARDERADTALTAAGWRVVRLWEHEDPADAASAIAAVVGTINPLTDPSDDAPHGP
jgi:DNA mismatch endonuclease (patch repair protein)